MRGEGYKNEKDPGTCRDPGSPRIPLPLNQPHLPKVFSLLQEIQMNTGLLPSNHHYPHSTYPLRAEALGHPSHSTGVKQQPSLGAMPA